MDQINRVANFFKNFGDKTRLSIIINLLEGELSVNEKKKKINMSQTSTSHQLKILRENNIVNFRKVGKSSIYYLDDEHVEKVIFFALEHINHIDGGNQNED